MRSGKELIAEAKALVVELSGEELQHRLASATPPRLLDVREPDELSAGRLPGALHLPRGLLELRVEQLCGRDGPIVVYCAGGVRSALAARTLRELGYPDVSSLAGGFQRWKEEGRPLAAEALTPAQRERYGRHLVIPEVGEAGQRRLLAAKVAFLGAGGLGSPAALYCAAAGVGTIGLIDADKVERSNLQRQVLHTTARVGEPKVESGAATLRGLNPDVKVIGHETRLTSANARELLAPYDVIVDGGDNFPTRYLLNDAARLLGKPLVHGSIFRFEGHVTTFLPDRGPCYRCLFPAPPPPALAPSCAEAGVLGVLPGVVGCLQANEVLKLLLGVGEPLVGRLLFFDALAAEVRTLRVARDPGCTICAGGPITLADYEQFCAVSDARR